MKPRERALLATALATILVILVGTFAWLGSGSGPQLDPGLTMAGTSETETSVQDASPRDAKQPAAAPEPGRHMPLAAATGPPEPLIEDLLAEHGEDPGAVYYMSRVREALREGNPGFARELLRQMKEQHPNSVLNEEAESLFQGTR